MLGRGGSSSGGGPPSATPPSYIASAVHFDGNTWLSTASLTATDNGFISYAGWFKYPSPGGDADQIWVVDPENTFTSNLSLHATFGFLHRISPVGGAPIMEIYTDPAPSLNAWHSAIVSIDTLNQAGKIYVDDVDVTVLAEGDPFSMSFNGLPFFVGSDTFGVSSSFTGDVADLRIMPGVSLLSAGDIPEATRRLFIDVAGKPVDPATATAALGAPCVLFSGDATAFETNQGTGGAFMLTGALTDASTSPSD